MDYLERWAWYETSTGRHSDLRSIADDEAEREMIEMELWAELDIVDPMPASAFVAAPIQHPPHLRLLPALMLALL